MFAVHLLEEAGLGPVSVWTPAIVLGWFLLMTLTRWQVSRRNTGRGNDLQAADTSHSENNPSEFDNH